MIYCISYDLSKPGQNYEALYQAIESYGTWWHQTGSVWLICSQDSPIIIRNNLLRYIDKNDKIFVIELTNNWAGAGFQNREYEWLKSLPDAAWN